MTHDKLTKAFSELTLEGALQKGWSIKDEVATVADGDTMPTDQEMTDALARRTARLANDDVVGGQRRKQIRNHLGMNKPMFQDFLTICRSDRDLNEPD